MTLTGKRVTLTGKRASQPAAGQSGWSEVARPVTGRAGFKAMLGRHKAAFTREMRRASRA